MADPPVGHKLKMKPSEKSRSSSSRKPPAPDTSSVGMSKLDLSGGGGITFEVRELVWEQLEQKLNVVEWEEAKSILGENIIEENKALKEENLALLSIWKDFTQTTSSIEEQCQEVYKGAKSPLPEPPHVRDLLFKQLKFFIDELPTRSKREIVASTTPREKVVYDYVTRGTLPSRPSTASGSRDKPTDIRPTSARSSGTPTPPLSPGSPHDLKSDGLIGNADAAQNLLRTQDHLDLDVLQANASQLKAMLAQEHELLLQDAEFLQFCLEQQADYNSQLQKISKEKHDSAVPTIQEMKEFNSRLEQKYLEMSHGTDKEKEKKSTSSARPRTTSLPDAPPKSRHPHPPSSSTPPPRSRSSLTTTPITPIPSKSPLETSGESHTTPHPPKEQRPDSQRPRAKLSNITLSPSLPIPTISSTEPQSPNSLPSITSSLNASTKRTRLKQTQPG